ncbi:3-oxoacyl-[acyl-carrier-protein] synthase [Tulasnella sp. 427]|nr:3-oxoacyl-[acyl-carrier-protein] synthase [Tulasnella sp. 427]
MACGRAPRLAAADGRPERVVSYDDNFAGRLCLVAAWSSYRLCLTGQGSKDLKGTELYKSAPAARTVWETAGPTIRLRWSSRLLANLTNVLGFLKKKADLGKLTQTMSVEKFKASVGYSGSLGKYMVPRMEGRTMHGTNLSSTKSYLTKAWGFALPDQAELFGFSDYGVQSSLSAWKPKPSRVAAGRALDAPSRSGFSTGHRLHADEKASTRPSSQLDDISKESGDAHIQGIYVARLRTAQGPSLRLVLELAPALMWYNIILGPLITVECNITSRCVTVMNCADPSLLRHIRFYFNSTPPAPSIACIHLRMVDEAVNGVTLDFVELTQVRDARSPRSNSACRTLRLPTSATPASLRIPL